MPGELEILSFAKVPNNPKAKVKNIIQSLLSMIGSKTFLFKKITLSREASNGQIALKTYFMQFKRQNY